MSLESLEQVLKRPTVAHEVPDSDVLRAAEEHLGTVLPQDYKDFLGAYGVGTINRFLVVLVPFASNQYVDLIKRGRSELNAYEISKTQFPKYYTDDVFPASGGLLPFATTDNGEVLYWRTVGDPKHWTVTVYESRGPKRFNFPGGMTDFLYSTLTGQIKCDVLPKSFVKASPEFHPLNVTN